MHADFATLFLRCPHEGCEDMKVPFHRVETERLVEVESGRVRYTQAVCVLDLCEDGFTVEGLKWEKIKL